MGFDDLVVKVEKRNKTVTKHLEWLENIVSTTLILTLETIHLYSHKQSHELNLSIKQQTALVSIYSSARPL